MKLVSDCLAQVLSLHRKVMYFQFMLWSPARFYEHTSAVISHPNGLESSFFMWQKSRAFLLPNFSWQWLFAMVLRLHKKELHSILMRNEMDEGLLCFL